MDHTSSNEHPAAARSGYLALAIGLLAILVPGAALFESPSPAGIVVLAIGLAIAYGGLVGLYMLQPNQAALMTLFGSYRGTDRVEGLRWANPFYTKRKISVRARNFMSERLKVNDLRGNPIEIAAAIVWRIADTAQATFDVESVDAYVVTQAESALRHLALSYPYDDFEDPLSGARHEITLRSGTDEVATALRAELQARFALAGIVVVDAKLTHLAYAPEIAGTMLRRQQAEAVIAARAKIVQGAVGMVDMALRGLAERGLVELDGERRAAMVSNLLVVLCSDRDATPVVNAGTPGG